MSSGTNPERLSQNNELLIANNTELENLKTIISTLPQVPDLSDATALETDIASGKTAYNANGIITGTLNTFDAGMGIATKGTFRENVTDGNVYLDYSFINDKLFRSTSSHALYIAEADLASSIGLTADILAVGNTILGIEGANAGLDTSDATATAADILQYKTAYVNGEKITGSMYEIMNFDGPCDKVTNGENTIYISKDNIPSGYYTETNNLRLNASYDLIVDAIGLIPGQIVEGNTILGVQGTATELDVTKTEIYDTTNNNIIVGLDDLVLYKDQGTVGFRVNIPSSITQKEQILISGTGYIELQSFVQGTGCLCVRLNSMEELETYTASDGEYVVIIDESNNYLGTYYYTANTWSEVVSSTAYDNTLTETEYDEAVETTHTILGEEEV